jgi:hypothetical protein
MMKSFAGRLCPFGHALGLNTSLNTHGSAVLSSRVMSDKAGSGMESGVKGPNGGRIERDWVVIGGSVLSIVGFVFLFAKKSDIDKLEQKMDADNKELKIKMDTDNKELRSDNKELKSKMDTMIQSNSYLSGHADALMKEKISRAWW